MTDQQLRLATEAELRARFNAAPGYLEKLLERKRALEAATVWELDLRGRGASPRNPRSR